jgi:uncharacterized protein (DUF305 family)
MHNLSPLLRTAAALAAIASVVCTAATAQAKAANRQPGYVAADVRFMSGMIHHHAQAVLMAGWAPSHDASPSVQTLCERIVVSQRDEITLMRRWLQARHEPVPDSTAAHAMMPEMEPATMMPGMLTGQQLAQLDRARGPEFDRLFLTFMIQHHQGAITMVNQLFGQGAGEQETVFRFASDVYADQSTEIARMQKMLAALLFEGHGQ